MRLSEYCRALRTESSELQSSTSKRRHSDVVCAMTLSIASWRYAAPLYIGMTYVTSSIAVWRRLKQVDHGKESREVTRGNLAQRHHGAVMEPKTRHLGFKRYHTL